MKIEALREELADPKVLGTYAVNTSGRRVLVQIPRDGYYEYREISAVGALFHQGEFVVVIATDVE